MDGEAKVLGVIDKRPFCADTLTPFWNDSELIGKTYYFKKYLQISIAIKNPKVFKALHFTAKQLSIDGCYNEDSPGCELKYTLIDITSHDPIPEECMSLIQWNDEHTNASIMAKDVLFARAYQVAVLLEDYDKDAIKIEYKKVKEVK